jgi:hypothetical protein
MIASQNNLRGTLESGDAVSLIEKLANLSLIEELIAAVKAKLPNGSTSGLLSAKDSLSQIPAPVWEGQQLEVAMATAQKAVKDKLWITQNLKDII